MHDSHLMLFPANCLLHTCWYD